MPLITTDAWKIKSSKLANVCLSVARVGSVLLSARPRYATPFVGSGKEPWAGRGTDAPTFRPTQPRVRMGHSHRTDPHSG